MPINILVVDDNLDNHLIIRTGLASPDYCILEARSGSEALAILENSECAVILLDIQMPGMSGFEVARAVRGKNRTREIPIIFVSATNRTPADVREGYEIGAVDFLLKPFNVLELRAKVTFFVQLYRKDQLIRQQEVATAIHRGEAQLRLITDALPVLIAYVGADRRYRFVNRAYEEWHGKTTAEMIGKHTSGFFKTEVYRSRETHVQKVLRGETQSFENRVNHPRHGVREVRINYIPDRDADGGTRGFVVLVTDITEAKNTETELEKRVDTRTQELSRSRAFLDSLIENLPNMIFVKDAAELRFIRLNKAGERLLGLPRERLMGKNDTDFFPAEQARHFQEKDRAVLAQGHLEDIAEEPILTGSGPRILHTKKIPIYGHDGKPEYLLGISEDITERKKSEELLQISRQQLMVSHAELERRVLERTARLEELNRRLALEEGRARFLAEAGVVLAASLDYDATLKNIAKLAVSGLADWCSIDVLDPDGTYRNVALEHRDPKLTPFAETFQILRPKDWSSHLGVAEVLRTGQSKLIAEITPDTLQERPPNPEHLQMILKFGPHSALVVPMIARGRTLAAITLVLTKESDRQYHEEDQRMAEDLALRAGLAADNARLYAEAEAQARDLQSAVQARDEFLSIASHELRTPLTPLKLQIQGLVRYLRENDPVHLNRDRIEKLVDTSNRQVRRITTLIEDLLDVSRISAGKLTLHPEDLDIPELIRETLEGYLPQLSAAHCPVEFRCPPEPILGWMDRSRLEQVLVNLLTNAMKYAAGKPILIELKKLGSRIRLSVQDQGIGIPPENLSRIFNRFERLGSAQNVGGLGLGLYITQQIVNHHGGTIHAESRPQQGATFVVELPLRQKSPPPPLPLTPV